MTNNEKLVTSADRSVKITGKVFYNDHRRRIELKKPVRDLFDLDSENMFYVMELGFSPEAVHKRIKELFDKRVVPIITYFVEDEIKEVKENA